MNNLNSYLKIDNSIISQFDEKLDGKKIIFNVTNIESSLNEYNICEEKIDDIFKVMIEIMNNILNYSYNTKDIGNHKNEANGIFSIDIDTKLKICNVQSSNLILDTQKDLIQKRFLEVQGLDKNGLRKLKRKKMRARYDVHDKGAGLGFLTMALIVTKPIEIEFTQVKDNILKYTLKLVL